MLIIVMFVRCHVKTTCVISHLYSCHPSIVVWVKFHELCGPHYKYNIVSVVFWLVAWTQKHWKVDILRIIMKHMNGGDTYVKSSITNGHFIHANPLKRTGVSIYLKSSSGWNMDGTCAKGVWKEGKGGKPTEYDDKWKRLLRIRESMKCGWKRDVVWMIYGCTFELFVKYWHETHVELPKARVWKFIHKVTQVFLMFKLSYSKWGVSYLWFVLLGWVGQVTLHRLIRDWRWHVRWIYLILNTKVISKVFCIMAREGPTTFKIGTNKRRANELLKEWVFKEGSKW